MICLVVYLKARPGRTRELETAIVERWMEAMARQPGFRRAALLRPFADEHLSRLGAVRPDWDFEVASYWDSEEERVAWVGRDIHQEVWPQVVGEAAQVSYTLFEVAAGWSL
ncbi:MAG: antibiotic biosynthesis monooxygenase [Candidatus Latescibacterota bacterium]